MKLLEEHGTRLSLAVRLADPPAAPQGAAGQTRVAIQGARRKPLVHRRGYWLFLDVPPGPRTLSWETERYQDGQQTVNADSVPALAPVVNVQLAAPLPVSITLASLTRGHIGKPYQAQISRNGGKAPFRFAATGLPAGLSVNRVTGMVAGTPTVKGTSQVTVSVTDNNATHDEKTYRLAIVA
jgi:hypothetical protein